MGHLGVETEITVLIPLSITNAYELQELVGVSGVLRHENGG